MSGFTCHKPVVVDTCKELVSSSQGTGEEPKDTPLETLDCRATLKELTHVTIKQALFVLERSPCSLESKAHVSAHGTIGMSRFCTCSTASTTENHPVGRLIRSLDQGRNKVHRECTNVEHGRDHILVDLGNHIVVQPLIGSTCFGSASVLLDLIRQKSIPFLHQLGRSSNVTSVSSRIDLFGEFHHFTITQQFSHTLFNA